MTGKYGDVQVAVDSGECYKSFSESENIGSYLVAGRTYCSPLELLMMPLGSALEVVTSAFIRNNAFAYCSIRIKTFPSWLPRGNFRWSSMPLRSIEARPFYLLGMLIKIRKS